MLPRTDARRQIIFATILERIFFHVYPSYLSIFGTLIILVCAIFVAVRTPVRFSHRHPANDHRRIS